MKIGEIIKAGIIGGIVSIVLKFIVGFAGANIAYIFGFIALLIGGIVAGWNIKTKQEDAIASGILSSLIYVILGLFVIFPLGKYHSGNPVGAVVIGLILGAIGGFVGKYLSSNMSMKKKQ